MLFALATVQVLVLCLVVFVLRPPPSVGTLIGLILLTAFAGVSMGLLISAAVRNENQATSFIPLALIPELLFAGQIVPLKDMPGFLRAVSDIIFSRWALQGVGTAVDLNGRFAATGNPSSNPLGSHFFNLSPGLAALILLTFTLVLLAGTGWRVKAMKA